MLFNYITMNNFAEMILSAPLDQFWGRREVPGTFVNTGGAMISHHIFFMMIIVALYILTGLHYSQYRTNINNMGIAHFLLNSAYFLVKSITRSTTVSKRNEHFAILFALFIFIVLANGLGLIPYCKTITSSMLATLALSFIPFFAINILGAWKRNYEFFSIFMADGVPVWISPLLVPIEIISYISRVFSLSIRLFANMMSGHALLKILTGFSFLLLCSGNFFGIILAVFPWIIVTMILLLEVLIAFLQSYVFITLLSIYINDATTSH